MFWILNLYLKSATGGGVIKLLQIINNIVCVVGETIQLWLC